MYSLFAIGTLFFIYVIHINFFKNTDKKAKIKFEKITNCNFILNYLDIYLNNKLTETISMNNTKYINKEDILVLSKFDYYIMNYNYNNNNYKKLINNNKHKFPIYSKNEISNYVYINKISKIHVYQDNNEVINIIDITDKLLEFIGPNYNFYLDCNPMVVSDYLNILNIDYNKNTSVLIYDNFNNEKKYKIDDVLSWNPNLID